MIRGCLFLALILFVFTSDLKKEFFELQKKMGAGSTTSRISSDFARVNFSYLLLFHPDFQGVSQEWIFGDRRHFVKEMEGLRLRNFFINMASSESMEQHLESLMAVEKSFSDRKNKKNDRKKIIFKEVDELVREVSKKQGFSLVLHENFTTPKDPRDFLFGRVVWSENLKDLTLEVLDLLCQKKNLELQRCKEARDFYKSF